MVLEAQPRHWDRNADGATERAILSLESVSAGLQSLVRDQASIRWNHPRVRPLWLDAYKLARSLDHSLAVLVYSYHATDLGTVRYLLDREVFSGAVWEPCSGDGAIAREIEARGFTVHASDLRDCPDIYGQQGVDVFDLRYAENVITNPPFWNALAIAEHLISVTTYKVALLLRIEFLGSQSRRRFFQEHPPVRVYPLPARPVFAVGGNRSSKQSTQWDFGWYVWERGFQGETRLVH